MHISEELALQPLPHVLLDCTAIPANRGGVGRYVEGLLRGLSYDQVRLTLIVQKRDRETLREIVRWADVYSLPKPFLMRPLRFTWEQFGLPGVAKRLGADVLHSPHYTFPIRWNGRRVVTVHDATFFSDPKVHSPIKRRFFRMWIRRAWRLADVVVTPSAATAGEVERFIGAPRAHIEVALLGVNQLRFRAPTTEQLSQFRRNYGLAEGERWFAFLGTIEPRKNVTALLDAHQELRAELGSISPTLLIAGGRGWDNEAVARLDALDHSSGARELGYVPLDSLPALLGGAVAVIYPSLGEGFGLPVLEAMSCGAAVVTTNRLAIPEVGGNAVVYIEPNADAIMQAMLALYRDDTERSRLSKLAVARAALFTWRATARSHVSAYTVTRGSLS